MSGRSSGWGDDAVVVVPPGKVWPTPHYAFNRQRVGKGCKYRNESGSPHRVAINLKIGVVERRLWFWSVISNYKTLKCTLDTGADESVFGSEAANDLGLVPPQRAARNGDQGIYTSDKEKGCAFLETVTLADDTSRSIWWCYRDVGVNQNGSDLLIRGRFPLRTVNVDHGGLRFDWEPACFRDNLLGMGDLLDARMLCVTPEALFMLARLGT